MQRFLIFLKQFNLQLIIVLGIGFLLVTGKIYDLLPALQMVGKKTFYVAWWYLLTYLFRRFRLGTINWEDLEGNDQSKKLYYFVLLICSALIFALG